MPGPESQLTKEHVDAMLDQLMPTALELMRNIEQIPVDEDTRMKLINFALSQASSQVEQEVANASIASQLSPSGPESPIQMQHEAEAINTTGSKADSATTPAPTETISRNEASFEVPEYNVSPGSKQSFIMGRQTLTIPLRRETPESPPRLATGVLAVIDTIVDRSSSSYVDPDAPIVEKVGPRMFVSNVGMMGYDATKALLQDTAEHLAIRLGGPASHYRERLDTSPFKLLLSTEEALEEDDWTAENSCLLLGGGPDDDLFNAAYPYLVPSESAGNFTLKFAAEGPPEHIRFKVMPLGTIALTDNIIVAAPYEDYKVVGSEPYPEFRVFSSQPAAELRADLDEAFEEIRHWSGGRVVALQEAHQFEEVAIPEVETGEVLMEAIKPEYVRPDSIVGPRVEAPTARRRIGHRGSKKNGTQKVIELRGDGRL